MKNNIIVLSLLLAGGMGKDSKLLCSLSSLPGRVLDDILDHLRADSLLNPTGKGI